MNITRDWLSEMLGKPIQDFQITPFDTTTSQGSARIAADGQHYFLKRYADCDWEAGFYEDVQPLIPQKEGLLHCYGVQREGLETVMLLDDISETHVDAESVKTSGDPRLGCIDALVEVYAACWEHPKLPEFLPKTAAKVEHLVTFGRDNFAQFVDGVGDLLSDNWRMNYEKILSVVPPLEERRKTFDRVTVTHGDTNLSNFMRPKDATGGHMVVIDWFLWDVNTPADDMVMLIALASDAAERRTIEKPYLLHLLERLRDRGIENYDWETLWQDYRQSILLKSLLPIFWHQYGLPESIWLDGVRTIMTAFDDLGCEELV